MNNKLKNNSEHLVDLNEAQQAVKENRFSDAIKILKIILDDYPNHIDCLYMAAVF